MGTSGAQSSEEQAMAEDAGPAAVPQLEPESPAAELERQERAAESARRHDDWVAKLERAKLTEETESPSVGSPPDPGDYTREEFLKVYPEYEELAKYYFDEDEDEVSPQA